MRATLLCLFLSLAPASAAEPNIVTVGEGDLPGIAAGTCSVTTAAHGAIRWVPTKAAASPRRVIPDPYGHYPDGLLVIGTYPDGRGLVWCVPVKYPDLENVLLTPEQAGEKFVAAEPPKCPCLTGCGCAAGDPCKCRDYCSCPACPGRYAAGYARVEKGEELKLAVGVRAKANEFQSPPMPNVKPGVYRWYRDGKGVPTCDFIFLPATPSPTERNELYKNGDGIPRLNGPYFLPPRNPFAVPGCTT